MVLITNNFGIDRKFYARSYKALAYDYEVYTVRHTNYNTNIRNYVTDGGR